MHNLGLRNWTGEFCMFLYIHNRITVPLLLFVSWLKILYIACLIMCSYRSQSCESKMGGQYCGSWLYFCFMSVKFRLSLIQRPPAVIEGVLGFASLLQPNDRLVGCSYIGYDYFFLRPPD